MGWIMGWMLSRERAFTLSLYLLDSYIMGHLKSFTGSPHMETYIYRRHIMPGQSQPEYALFHTCRNLRRYGASHFLSCLPYEWNDSGYYLETGYHVTTD